MKIFLTGASGYVGWELCKRLIDDGHDVNALCRTPSKTRTLANLTWVQGSLEDAASIRVAMEGCTHVFHCGGLARLWDPNPGAFYEVNVKGTENVLAAARYHRIEKLVFTSTAGVVGKSLSKPMTEDDPRLEPFDNDYDLTKFMAEQKVLEYAKEGHWAVIVSPSRVYGPGVPSPSNVITNTLMRYFRQPFYLVPGSGEQKSNFVFIGDVVDGHIRSMEYGTSGEKYILGGENASYNRLFEIIGNLSGVKRRRIAVPQGILSVIATLMVGWSKISGNPPFISPSFSKRLFHARLLSSEKAENMLGYKITSLMKGMAITLEALGYKNEITHGVQHSTLKPIQIPNN